MVLDLIAADCAICPYNRLLSKLDDRVLGGLARVSVFLEVELDINDLISSVDVGDLIPG